MVITLYLEPIHYDVEQLTHRYAEGRVDNPETKDLAQVDRNLSDKALVLRYVLTGTAKLRHILRDYLEKKNEDANDNLPWSNDAPNKTSWTFTFKEDKFDSHALAELMHWFVVRFCVWEWLKMFSPAEARAAKDELDDQQTALEDALVGGDMPMKERRNTDCCTPGCIIVPIYEDSDDSAEDVLPDDSDSDSEGGETPTPDPTPTPTPTTEPWEDSWIDSWDDSDSGSDSDSGDVTDPNDGK